jgi:AcrR family transcriptional regulator
MRADALRNRNRIEAAAIALISAHGAEVSMQAIAEEAGVAVGTLYCHYPTKADLVDAVIEASVERVALLAEPAAGRVAAGADPAEALAGLLRDIAAAAAQSRALRAGRALTRSLPRQARRWGGPSLRSSRSSKPAA